MKYWNIHTHKGEVKEAEDVFSIWNWEATDGDVNSCPSINYSLGIHPWKVNETTFPSALQFMEQHIRLENVKAVGECGLDKRCDTPWDLQVKVFRSQIVLSEQAGKPVIIHCVKAFNELIALHKELKPAQAWIIHGFRGKPQQMEELIQQGFYLSFGSHFNEETIRKMPLDKLLLETDDAEISIQQVYKKISECMVLTESTLINQLSQNCKNCRL